MFVKIIDKREVTRIAGLGVTILALLVASCGGEDRQMDDAGKASAASAVVAEPPAAEVAEAPPAGIAEAVSPVGNHPPRARFEVFPLRGFIGLTTLRFNANPCRDDSTHQRDLIKHWDFDGDGTWDMGPFRAIRLRHVYEEAGTFRPRLLVYDAGGLADSFVGPEIEIRQPCPAPDFELSDVNPSSPSYGQTISFKDLRGHRVMLWYATPAG
ncbi:MAG: hypothetical protein KAY32_01610 [Candidatus Eisenbacteria sp.]|nr:hypothetical protein [Candidatus Eisenbacteria bacterium]